MDRFSLGRAVVAATKATSARASSAVAHRLASRRSQSAWTANLCASSLSGARAHFRGMNGSVVLVGGVERRGERAGLGGDDAEVGDAEVLHDARDAADVLGSLRTAEDEAHVVEGRRIVALLLVPVPRDSLGVGRESAETEAAGATRVVRAARSRRRLRRRPGFGSARGGSMARGSGAERGVGSHRCHGAVRVEVRQPSGSRAHLSAAAAHDDEDEPQPE